MERGALLWGLLTSCAIQSGIGLAQFAQQTTLGLRDLGEIIMRPEWSGASVITVNGARVLRAYALTQHPNMLGGLLMVGVVTGCGVALTPRTVRWPTAVAIGLTTLTLAGLLVTFSRAAWLGLAVAGAALLILLLPRAPAGEIPRGPWPGSWPRWRLRSCCFSGRNGRCSSRDSGCRSKASKSAR